MKVSFINHSCIRVESSSGLDVICDPWFIGEVFNESWMLARKVNPNLSGLDEKSVIFISHEHPDHLNFPTLKKYFSKQRVILRSGTRHGVVTALEKLNFPVLQIPTNSMHEISNIGDRLGLFPRGGDTAIIIEDGVTKEAILNFNDCEFSEEDIISLRDFIGRDIDFICGQFGLAGFYANEGEVEKFRQAYLRKIKRLQFFAELFKPKVLLPFASFVRFSKTGNSHINQQQPDISEVVARIKLALLDGSIVWIPFPNEQVCLSHPLEQINLASEDRIAFWNDSIKSTKPKPKIDDSCSIKVVLEEINLFQKRASSLVNLLKDVAVQLNVSIRTYEGIFDLSFDPLKIGSVSVNVNRADFEVPSDEFVFALRYRWGPDTLNITGSAKVFREEGYILFLRVIDLIHQKLEDT